MLPPVSSALIERLALVPHPEGGYYREIFRSTATVAPADGRGHRAALTCIWFLLVAGQHSRWHRISSDEVWVHQDGGPLELLRAEATGGPVQRIELTSAATGGDAVAVIPAGVWQAARPLADFSLVGCTVGPGFDFADFSFLADDADAADAFRGRHPLYADLI
jgi:hypothetical protein